MKEKALKAERHYDVASTTAARFAALRLQVQPVAIYNAFLIYQHLSFLCGAVAQFQAARRLARIQSKVNLLKHKLHSVHRMKRLRGKKGKKARKVLKKNKAEVKEWRKTLKSMRKLHRTLRFKVRELTREEVKWQSKPQTLFHLL
jgi:hypothetical protein